MNTSMRANGMRMITLALAVTAVGCGRERREAIRKAETQVQRIASDLDAKTTPTGSYVRVPEGEVKETDPWGTVVKVSYTQGGVAENVEVRSAGPDLQFHTDDDVVAGRMSANFKGVGQGIKENAGAVAADVAKGAVKGAASGVKDVVKEATSGAKESVKGAWPFKKKQDGEAPVEAGQEQSDKPATPAP